MIYQAIDHWNRNNLEHKNGFKYILKLPIGGSFRYFYSQAEIDAYRAGQNSDLKSVANRGKSLLNRYKNSVLPKKDSLKTSKKSFNQPIEEKGIDPNGYEYIAKIEVNGYTRYFYSQEELLAYQRREDYLKNEPWFMKDVKKIEEPMTSEEDLVRVNPNYENENEDWQNNCAECTMIYELRRRGYDVESNGTSGIINSNDTIGQVKEFYDALTYNTDKRFDVCFEGAKTVNLEATGSWGNFNSEEDRDAAVAKLEKEIRKNPPNSRGDLSVTWKVGGGHSMVWEMDSKKNITIKDSQVSGQGKAEVYDIKELVGSTRYYVDGGLQITRTDNLKLKPGIKRIYKERESK